MNRNVDAYDCLQMAQELCSNALHSPVGAERLAATHQAVVMLQDAIRLQERGILLRWQAVGCDQIVAGDVAPTLEWAIELAKDMGVLGWSLTESPDGARIYRKPMMPLAALSRADWDGVVKAIAEVTDGQ